MTLYARQLREMISSYEAFSGKTFDEARFVSMMQNNAALEKAQKTKENANAKASAINIGIMGARCNNETVSF